MDLGKINYWKHPSKTNCVFVDKRELSLISIDIWCKAGMIFEERNKDGTAHFLEHMLFKGNKLLNSGDFDLRIESLGGSSNASTGYDDVHYYVEIPPNSFGEALILLKDLVFSPDFDNNEFNLEKKVIIEEILQNHDHKDERIFNYFLSRVWLESKYGKSILGKEENIENLKLIDLKNFHTKQYLPKNSCIAIAGKLPNDYLEILNNCKIKNTERNFDNREESLNIYNSIRKGKEIIFIKDIEFSRILIAWLIPNNREQKYILGFEILSSILSEGRNSILNRILKEDKQLVESVDSGLHAGELGSLFIVEATCKIENIERVEILINNLIENLLKTNNFINKIKKAIRIVKSNYLFNLETASQISYFFGSNLLWGRINPQHNLFKNLMYWENPENFKEIFTFLSKNKFTLIAQNKK